jgi:hypothetical protein
MVCSARHVFGWTLGSLCHGLAPHKDIMDSSIMLPLWPCQCMTHAVVAPLSCLAHALCFLGVLQLPAAMMLPDMYNASDPLGPYWRSLPPKESLLSIYNIPPTYIPMLQAAGPVSNRRAPAVGVQLLQVASSSHPSTAPRPAGLC